jgi:hypothetical protein
MAGIAGGLLLAAAVAWLGWHGFTAFDHPEWGPPVALAMLVLLAILARRSDLLQMTAFFELLAAGLLWPSGRDWRRRARFRRALAERADVHDHVPDGATIR